MIALTVLYVFLFYYGNAHELQALEDGFGGSLTASELSTEKVPHIQQENKEELEIGGKDQRIEDQSQISTKLQTERQKDDKLLLASIPSTSIPPPPDIKKDFNLQNFLEQMLKANGYYTKPEDSSNIQKVVSSPKGQEKSVEQKDNLRHKLNNTKNGSVLLENESLPKTGEVKHVSGVKETSEVLETKTQEKSIEQKDKLRHKLNNTKIGSVLLENDSLPKTGEMKHVSRVKETSEVLKTKTKTNSKELSDSGQKISDVDIIRSSVNQTNLDVIEQKNEPVNSCKSHPYGGVCMYVLLFSGSIYYHRMLQET